MHFIAYSCQLTAGAMKDSDIVDRMTVTHVTNSHITSAVPGLTSYYTLKTMNYLIMPMLPHNYQHAYKFPTGLRLSHYL